MYYQRYSNGGNYFWLVFLLLVIFGGLKTLLAIFGLVVAIIINFFPLIIAGYFVYRFVKKVGRNRFVNASLNMQTAEYKRFIEIMVYIMMHVAKADGKVSTQETQMIRQFFIMQMKFDAGKITWLNDIINSAAQSNETLESLASLTNFAMSLS